MKKRILALLIALFLAWAITPSVSAEEIPYGLNYKCYETYVEITGYYGTEANLVIPSQIEEIPVTTISDLAFSGCTNLISVTLPDTITSVEHDAFSRCSNLTKVFLSSSLTTIEDNTFFECTSLTDITIPDGVTSIGRQAFYKCTNLSSITLPSSITQISDYAFLECSSLREISLPNNLNTIGFQAFYNCSSLQSIIIPECVTSLGGSAFSNCTGLTSAVISGIDTINQFVFANCSALRDVTITSSVTSIGRCAFEDCTSLINIVLPDSITEIGSSSFSGCSSLIDVVLPENTVSIGEYAFSFCDALASITIPDKVTTIGDCAFYVCDSLTEFSISSSVSYIGGGNFFMCPNLTSIHVDEENEHYQSINDALFDKTGTTLIRCPSGKRGSFQIPDGVITISMNAFNNCSELYSIVIPDTVVSIGDQAFSDCYLLSNMTIPNSVTDIGAQAFASCFSLESITLSDSTISIGDFAFFGCSGLDSIIIPFSVQKIGEYAFDACDLTSVHFLGAPPDFDSTIFSLYTDEEGELLTVYYPSKYAEWEDKIALDYGRPIIWIPYTPNPFTDVPAGAFYEEPVLWAIENNITNGLSTTEFGPTATCNRAQVVTFLWRAAGCPEPTSAENPFVDVAAGSFYEKPVLWAVEKGITNGADATHFNPTGVCNRAQVVTFLYRAFESPAVSTDGLPFTDVPAGAWYEAPIAWAVENGITNGLSATEFGPNASCNRAQVVTFLYRAYN